MEKKFKSWLYNEQHFYAALLVGVGVSSFFLGRLSVSSDLVSTPMPAEKVRIIEIGSSTTSLEPVASPLTTHSSVIASKSGTKYHLESCPGATTIKPENRIIFPNSEAAEAAGYTKAANCPGL